MAGINKPCTSYSDLAGTATDVLEAQQARAPQELLFHYVIVRRDLPLGIIAANIVHAAGESVPHRMPEGTSAVVLAVPDEPALIETSKRLVHHGVAHTRIFEPNAPYFGQMMALGLVPARKEDLRRHLSSLPLLR